MLGFGLAFSIAFLVAVVIAVVVFAVLLLSLVGSLRTLRRGGIDPLTVPSQLAVRYVAGPDPVGRIEARLHELDDLRERGVISEDEWRAARGSALG
ncbi:hypothetical protein EV189_2923 [Motilibacter rhizosphaerae]|uniref:Uncharacterized protein n=1 Tax=Motilibacter rhizosphaerae TaxID=598652 RepID=A0A4Q7NQR7_9ACTN|nr:SHOCT domain-containing protein [Motilibacter rhizosphaerae]RZS87492.1 hypothetical protein EV189_2923 [Motilibacter rhizosphaerae]